MENKDNILVVGGAGYVGGYLVDCLLEDGYYVAVYDNLMYETRFLKEVDFIRGDARDKKRLKELFPQFGTVIWLAGIVGDGACQVDPFLTTNINEEMPIWLAQNFGGKIIFPSTCSVYGANHDMGLTEESPTNPLSLYGQTKLNAEQYLLENCEDVLCFRLGTLFGVGDHHSRIRLDLVANVLACKAAQGKVLSVFGGEQWRPLLHVKDVSTAIIHGMERDVRGLYNLCMGNWTIRELAEIIREIMEGTEVEYTEMLFEDLRNYHVLGKKFRETGWNPEFSIELGISEIMLLVENGRIRDLDDPVYSNSGYLNKNYWRIG